MMQKDPFIIVIYGPTGVGKTDLALKLGSHLPVEIINMDVGQLYTPLSIGTAKPDWRSSPIAHHLFDVISAPINITAVRYRALVEEKIKAIQARGNIPLLVGGSGFYLKSLLFPPSEQSTSIGIDEKYSTITDSVALWNELHAVDQLRAQAIHPHDSYRIKRALTIWEKTGRLPSEQKPIYDPVAPLFIVHLTREREQLYQRINERVHAMIDQGWVDEVAQLKDTPWEPFLLTKKLIGYDDILDYLAGKRTPERWTQTVDAIQKKSRHYAKRQETMWRGIIKHLEQVEKARILDEVNLTFIDLELYIKQLLKRIKYSRQS